MIGSPGLQQSVPKRHGAGVGAVRRIPKCFGLEGEHSERNGEVETHQAESQDLGSSKKGFFPLDFLFRFETTWCRIFFPHFC